MGCVRSCERNGSRLGKAVVFQVLWGLLGPSLLAAQATTFDPGTDFSLTNNPNGVWQYGYSLTNSLAPDQFRRNQYVERQGGVGFWHPSKSDAGQGYYPYVAFNTDRTRTDTTIGWAIRPGEVAMEGSNTGQYSLVRFVAPKAGTYEVMARFEAIHSGLSSTDVHVLHNAKSLFDADIDGYGGDSTYRTRQGSNPMASYTGRVELKDGDILTFAVGYGTNKSHYSDTTGLVASVMLVPVERRPRSP